MAVGTLSSNAFGLARNQPGNVHPRWKATKSFPDIQRRRSEA